MRDNRTELKNKLLNLLHKFKDNTHGSIQIMGAAGILASVGAISVTVDVARVSQAGQKLAILSDNATLAAASIPNETKKKREKTFKTMVETSIENDDLLENFSYKIKIKDTPRKTVIKTESQAETKLFFGLIGGSKRKVTAYTEVQIRKETIEVALVLDISSSMNGQRIIELKAAAKNFASTLLLNTAMADRVSISVVPYGGSVRLPLQFEHMLIPPATNTHWEGGVWNRCLELENEDYESGITTSITREYMPYFYVWNHAQPWCPPGGNEMMGLSTKLNKIHSKIDMLSLSDGTATSEGAAWGYATLDPNWRGVFPNVDPESPKIASNSTKKIMIVMTDGAISQQFRPLPSDMVGSLPFRTRPDKTNFSKVPHTNFANICDHIKANSIEVFTIGFLLKTPAHTANLKACATDEAHHYDADAGQLRIVFSELAASLSSLRIRK